MGATDPRPALRARGALLEGVPGLTGLRGPAAALHRALDRRLARLCREVAGEEWCVPAALSLDTLARADYFASFPQWLTLAAHLRDDEDALRGVAMSHAPAAAVAQAVAPAGAALPPAVCYHVYDALAGQQLTGPRYVTAQGTCWRHEGDRHAALERGWAFTMREIVCVGTAREVDDFVAGCEAHVLAFAATLGLHATVEPATDPFFAPSARGKRLLQQIQGLKRELLLPVDAAQGTAAASFNRHETRFGEAFDIRASDGRAAHTGCVAFGLERWTLAVLAEYGLEPADWPSLLLHHDDPCTGPQ